MSILVSATVEYDYVFSLAPSDCFPRRYVTCARTWCVVVTPRKINSSCRNFRFVNSLGTSRMKAVPTWKKTTFVTKCREGTTMWISPLSLVKRTNGIEVLESCLLFLSIRKLNFGSQYWHDTLLYANSSLALRVRDSGKFPGFPWKIRTDRTNTCWPYAQQPRDNADLMLETDAIKETSKC